MLSGILESSVFMLSGGMYRVSEYYLLHKSCQSFYHISATTRRRRGMGGSMIIEHFCGKTKSIFSKARFFQCRKKSWYIYFTLRIVERNDNFHSLIFLKLWAILALERFKYTQGP